MKNSSQYDKLKQNQDQEQLSIDDLAFMIGLPPEIIKEHLTLDDEKISIKDLQSRTRALVDDLFKSEP